MLLMKSNSKTGLLILAVFFILISALITYSVCIESKDIVLETIELSFKTLPKNFNGYKVAMLSDLHYDGEPSADIIKRAVDMANGIKPDIILLAGDFVSDLKDPDVSKGNIAPCMDILKELRAGSGIFAVLGNHDNMIGADEIAKALAGIGVTVLRNSHERIDKNKQHIYILGTDPIYLGAGSVKKSLVGIKYKDAFKILLSHIPDAVFEAESSGGIPLVLSGHTHGGQVKLPFYKSFIKGRFIFSDLIEGRYDFKDTILYITRGLGTILVPARFLSKPEVTEIILTKGK
jgi:predicted MPP superfamily phosphohydrolase